MLRFCLCSQSRQDPMSEVDRAVRSFSPFLFLQMRKQAQRTQDTTPWSPDKGRSQIQVFWHFLPWNQVPGQYPSLCWIIKRKENSNLLYLCFSETGPRSDNVWALNVFVNYISQNSWWIVHGVSPEGIPSIFLSWVNAFKPRFLEGTQKARSVMWFLQ